MLYWYSCSDKRSRKKLTTLGLIVTAIREMLNMEKKDKIKPVPFRTSVKQEGCDKTRNSDDKSN